MTRTRSLLALSPALLASALALAVSVGSGTASAATELHSMPQNVLSQPLTLLNGWASSQPIYGTGDPAVSENDGIVHLSGSLHQPSGTNDEFAVLPPAYRPGHTLYLPVYTYDGGEGSLEITPGGAMSLFGAGNTKAYSSLAGVSFPVNPGSHKVALINGWRSAQSTYGTGNPTVMATDGVVYLAGSLKQPSGSSGKFAVLPKAYRPSHQLYLPVYTVSGTEGSLEIAPSGSMWLFGSGSTKWFSSLAGVSFPIGLAPHKLTLINGWQTSQIPWDSGNPAASIDDGIVHLSGSMHLPVGSNEEATILPPAYRPSHRLYLPVYTWNGTENSLEITPSGAVYAFHGSTTQFTSLAGISYPAGA
ncbi:MAG TPA: hypothetical protein VIX86_10160 [Streptosporangiaceae bacterium]